MLLRWHADGGQVPVRRGGPVERGDAETRRILQKFKLLCESSSLPNPPKVQTPMRILQPPGTRALVTSAGLPGGRSSLSGGLGREGFGGFNSRPHRTNNLHDLLFWRIRVIEDVLVMAAKDMLRLLAYCAR